MDGIFFLLWIFLAVLVGLFANRRARSGAVWAILALLFSPLLMWLLLLALGRPSQAGTTYPQASGDTKKCPFCAEEIKLEAIKCKHCGSDLSAPASMPTSTKTSSVSTGDFMG